MKKGFRKWLGLVMGLGAVLAVIFGANSIGYAATTQDVQINATPAYVSISNSPATWDLNAITGSGYVAVDTVYYANPLGDTSSPSSTVAANECQFDLTDSGNVNMTLTVTCGNFTDGDATMTNSDAGSNGATAYGGYAWYAGLAYASKVIMKVSGSTALKSDHDGNLDWGAEIETRTDAWTGTGKSTATMTISATAS
jgi:hypothetical protein